MLVLQFINPQVGFIRVRCGILAMSARRSFTLVELAKVSNSLKKKMCSKANSMCFYSFRIGLNTFIIGSPTQRIQI